MHTFLIAPLIPIIVVVAILIGGSILFLGKLSPSNATRIAILGSKSVGKTTLWNQLRNRFDGSRTTVGIESLEQFEIEHNGKTKTIISPKDYSGDQDLVKQYDDVIQKDTFIYYLIDLTTLQEKKSDTRARIQKIFQVIKSKSLKESEFGFKLVATHYNDYFNQTAKTREEALTDLLQIIDLNSIEGIKIEERINENIIVAELTNPDEINQFRKEIIEF